MFSIKKEASSTSDRKSFSLQREISISSELITKSEFFMLFMHSVIDYLTPFIAKKSFILFLLLLISHI